MADVGVSTVKQQNRGKRRIPIKKLEDRMKKHVTFSKRKKGLFKKASELCILTGAEIAIITFSGAGKVFTFGHPSADSVIQRYLYGGKTTNASSSATTPFTATATNNGNFEVTVAYHGNGAVNWPRTEVVPYGIPVNDRDDHGFYTGRREFSPRRVVNENEIELWVGNGPKNEPAAAKENGFWFEKEGLEERLGLQDLQVYLKVLEEVRIDVLLRLQVDLHDPTTGDHSSLGIIPPPPTYDSSETFNYYYHHQVDGLYGCATDDRC